MRRYTSGTPRHQISDQRERLRQRKRPYSIVIPTKGNQKGRLKGYGMHALGRPYIAEQKGLPA